MFITAVLLVLLGINVTLFGVLLLLRKLRLDPLELLMYFGLAEIPTPPVPRRR